MKTYIKLPLIAFIVFFIFLKPAQSQCPGCAINFSCTANPAYPTICPDTLPPGMAGQTYSEDISFWMPAQFNDPGSGMDVTLNQLTIVDMVGLPFGLNWQTNSPTNIYYPSSSPPATEYGCAKICGTPAFAGSYIATVFIHVEVGTIIGNQSSDDSFTIPITILPDTSGNASFTIINSIGCGSVTACFQTNMPSGGNSGFSYNWNFGNGLNSTLEAPPCQTYSTPGTYDVTCHTVVDTLGFNYLNNVTVIGTSCDDWPFSAPDLYLVITDQSGGTIYSCPYVLDTDPPVSFAIPNLQLYNQNYTINVWDDDSPGSSNDFCNAFVINGLSMGGTLWNGSDGITYTSTHPLFTFNDTATVTVYPNPATPVVSVTPNDTICSGDTITLSITTTNTIQWHQDTITLLGAINNTYKATTSGDYFVVVTDTNGCSATSAIHHLTVFQTPPKPTFWRDVDTLKTILSGYPLQWYLNNVAIPGATSQKLVLTTTGDYFLIAAKNGCSHSSDTVNFIYSGSGIDENNAITNIRIFPNPSHGTFTLKFETPHIQSIRIAVKDVIGNILYNETIPGISGTLTKQLLLTDLAKGIYILELRTESTTVTRKIVIQ